MLATFLDDQWTMPKIVRTFDNFGFIGLLLKKKFVCLFWSLNYVNIQKLMHFGETPSTPLPVLKTKIVTPSLLLHLTFSFVIFSISLLFSAAAVASFLNYLLIFDFSSPSIIYI